MPRTGTDGREMNVTRPSLARKHIAHGSTRARHTSDIYAPLATPDWQSTCNGNCWTGRPTSTFSSNSTGARDGHKLKNRPASPSADDPMDPEGLDRTYAAVRLQALDRAMQVALEVGDVMFSQRRSSLESMSRPRASVARVTALTSCSRG